MRYRGVQRLREGCAWGGRGCSCWCVARSLTHGPLSSLPSLNTLTPPPSSNRSYLALMRFAQQCLAAQLQQQHDQQQQLKQQQQQQAATPQVPAVYLTLLEGGLTRDATSELTAAALLVREAALLPVRSCRAILAPG